MLLLCIILRTCFNASLKWWRSIFKSGKKANHRCISDLATKKINMLIGIILFSKFPTKIFRVTIFPSFINKHHNFQLLYEFVLYKIFRHFVWKNLWIMYFRDMSVELHTTVFRKLGVTSCVYKLPIACNHNNYHNVVLHTDESGWCGWTALAQSCSIASS